MKVALMSFHNAYNYGAALQAYALQMAVESCGVECEYINYVNEYRRTAYDMNYQFKQAIKDRNIIRAAKVLVGTPFIRARGKRFDRFYSEFLNKSTQLYSDSKEAVELNDRYERFIVGSDQVWNPENNGGDAAFLLDFVTDNSKKISYSSSFGIDRIPDEYKEIYREKLSCFNYIGVREKRGVDIVNELTGRKAQQVLDPVFLVDRSKWDSIRDRRSRINDKRRKKYIFFYTNRTTQVDDFFLSGYKLDGKSKHILSTHVTPRDFLDPRTRVKVSMSPEDFLNEIAEADMVVTASFHCLAFSIIFHKQFSVILTGDYGKDERILSLLKLLDLEDRIIDSSTSRDKIEELIDYEKVDIKLNGVLSKSKEYLESAIFRKDFDYTPLSNLPSYFCDDMRCTGCSACASVCPVNAIEMRHDNEGFLVPIRNTEVCINCLKCHDVCQVFSKESESNRQKYYAVKNVEAVRKNSSSGGVFYSLAEYIINKRGIVCAAGMSIDYKVCHIFSETMEDIKPMLGTYYVQSEIGTAYSRIKEALSNNRCVLFVGTACQVKGLYSILSDQEKEGLITCDILCHGVPSPLIYDNFLSYMRSKGSLDSFKFRDKSLGWKGYQVSAVIDGKKVSNKLWLQSYNNMFSHNMINRLSCSSCLYSNYNRPGDITIGDFWGIEKSREDFSDRLGVSLVMTNTEIGEDVFSKLMLDKVIEVEKDETIQNSLLKPAVASSKRMQAIRTIKDKGYEKAMVKYGEVNFQGLLKNEIRKRLYK